MSKSVKDIAFELGVTKQAVLKKIDKLGLKDKLKKVANQYIINEEAENLIKSDFAPKSTNQQSQTNADTCKELLNIIDTLKSELEIKNQQIQDLSDRLGESQKLLMQQQQLNLLSEQKVLLLTEQAGQAQPIKKRWWQRGRQPKD